MKFLRTHALWAGIAASLVLTLIAALSFCLNTSALPETPAVCRLVTTFPQAALPPLAPVPEENSADSFQGVIPGSLPPALVPRRNGERQPFRPLRSGDADLQFAFKLLPPPASNPAKSPFAISVIHSWFTLSIPPRAGPSWV